MTEQGSRQPALAFVAPFLVFVALMGLERGLKLPAEVFYPVRLAAVGLTLALFSRRQIGLRPQAPWGSVAVGVLVFLVWIGPDVVFGPGYRRHWLFENPIMGAASSTSGEALRSVWFLAVRTLGCAALVPVIEELFWRGWLMRWIEKPRWWDVPLGHYAPKAFWIVALLFASEHGAYWEVGLAAGLVYNWWMVRTRCLADCILAHAVTNACLSAYVMAAGQFQYWG